MAAYIYVLWAIRDGIVKVGRTTRFNKRPSEHNGNSSNPLNFQEWKLYRFEAAADATRIERLALGSLRDQGFSYREKRELFECSPTDATKTIDAALERAGISCFREYPFNVMDALAKFSDFPTLPEFAFDIFTEEQDAVYRKGVADAFGCLAYLDGIKITAPDLLRLATEMNSEHLARREIWPTIVDYYRNLPPASLEFRETREIGEIAAKRIAVDRSKAYRDWQRDEDQES